MCGIFGFVVKPGTALGEEHVKSVMSMLFRLSESRGSEAAGLAIAGDNAIEIYKRAESASKMTAHPSFRDYISRTLTAKTVAAGVTLIGHSRLVTNGIQGMQENNQPVQGGHVVGVHNGIIVNDQELWRAHTDIERRTHVDSEVICRLIDKFYADGAGIQAAVRRTYGQLLGEANIAFVRDDLPALGLATNVGSLYFILAEKPGIFVFASEKHFLLELVLKSRVFDGVAPERIEQLKAGEGLVVAAGTLALDRYNLKDGPGHRAPETRLSRARGICDVSAKQGELRRCARCILPHTFPFISFDEQGVCNFCREAAPAKTDNKASLEERIGQYRSRDGSPDCIVALSGGRDSCYGLHVVKRELGLNPIAYTYDWAMVTDEARRNCSRVCAELGVEHIVRSADILSKRRNIRANIDAWLHRPDLGMIPLFMAGDKQFFYYASQVSRQTNVPLVIFCGGNNLETTRFKTGFCGIQDRSHNTMVGLDLKGKLQLLAYYARNFILNPRYLNRSVLDTLFAYYATYVNRQDFVYLYRYIDWNEEVIHKTLAGFYGWESSAGAASTWRIGDGTAAFYNYIYHTVAGFSEHDTFRSNQVRAGLITREAALALVAQENRPRYAAMQEYANLVGFSLDEALVAIEHIPKLA